MPDVYIPTGDTEVQPSLYRYKAAELGQTTNLCGLISFSEKWSSCAISGLIKELRVPFSFSLLTPVHLASVRHSAPTCECQHLALLVLFQISCFNMQAT